MSINQAEQPENPNDGMNQEPSQTPSSQAAEENLPSNDQHGAPSPAGAPVADTNSHHDDAFAAEAEEVRDAVSRIKTEIGKVIIGQSQMIELMIAALLTDGHILLEGVPGIAKTLTSKLLAKCLDVGFNRIQFTPDLMPTDIVGTTIFDMKRSEFYFKKGPVFSNVVLIDEINRAPAKTQAALMEVMEEEQVTVDGVTYKMEPPFFVIATQNPVEQEGTYKLPEAQLDRFMFKLIADYPSLSEEESMLQRFKNDFYDRQQEEVRPVVNAKDLIKFRFLVERVFIKDELIRYIAQIVSQTRNNSDLYLGASPRASINILKASKSLALISGRSFVTPDDIKRATFPVLNHRLILSYDREIEGVEIKEIVESILRKVEVPR
jgi:MoxR-like ATPase